MTLEKVHKLTAMHSDSGSGYNRNASQMALGKVMHNHDQQVVDDLIREYGLEQQWKTKLGTKLEGAFKS